MGSLGEQLLECLLVFTTLRLEMNWQMHPVGHIQLETSQHLRDKNNVATKKLPPSVKLVQS